MTPRRYRLVVGGVLAADAALLLWNALRFDWLRGYDAYANDRYAEIVWTEQRLPGAAESGTWHTPPLWFAAAGGLRALGSSLGAADPQRGGQLLAAAAGFAICLLVLALARALWPGRHTLHVVALVVACASPALVRASAMFHPETLAVALATGGVLVAVRALKGRPTLVAGLAAGALLGLASLTRAWALPVLVVTLVALLLRAHDPAARAAPVAMLAVAGILLAPWLGNQQAAHGSVLAFNREAPAEAFLSRRPASFYLGPRLLHVFEEPVTPADRNELVPQLYADWWGDWALTWDTSPPPAPGQLYAEGVVESRVLQLTVGIVPTFLALAGLLGLAALAVLDRSPALGLVALAGAVVAVAYLVFAIRFPSPDGDTIKATYLLMALPAAALGTGFVVDTLVPRQRRWRLVLAAALVALVAVQLPFLVL